MAGGKDQSIAILGLPAAEKQKSEDRVPKRIKKSFWVQPKRHEKASPGGKGLEDCRAQGQQNVPRSCSLPFAETEDSIVASAECLLSLANSQTSSQLRWGASDSEEKEGMRYSADASNEVTNLPLSQESVTMKPGREPALSTPARSRKRSAGSELQPAYATKQKGRGVTSHVARPSDQSDLLRLQALKRASQIIGKPQETNDGLSFLKSWSCPNEELALATDLLGEAARSMSEGQQHPQLVREQHLSKKARVSRPAYPSQLLMHPVARGPQSASAEARQERSASERSASERATLPRCQLLDIQPRKSPLLLQEERPVEHITLVDTQESQAGVRPQSKALEARKWQPDWQFQVSTLAGEEEPQVTSASQQTESCGKALGPSCANSGEAVKMERLYDFFGRPFRIYVPAKLWGAGVGNRPEIQAQREKESRLVLSELGTMIGLKNARQYSPEFTLSKISDDKIINLTSFELADKFLAKVTKNEATREQLRAHLKKVTLPSLRMGTLVAKPEEEDAAKPTSVLALAEKVIELRAEVRSQLGDVQMPIDFDKDIVKQTRLLGESKLTIVVVGKPGSAKSLTCNRLLVPGSDGMEGPFHPVPESRDHGTVVPIFVEKTNNPGLTTQVVGRRKEQYVTLVERRYRGGAISDEQLKHDYQCERVNQGPNAWRIVCSCPGNRLVVPALEAVIPGIESVGSDPKARARFYTSRIRQHYTTAQQLMMEKVVLQSNQWEGLEENWALGDTVGYEEQESPLSDLRGVTDDIVRESVRDAPVVVHCCVSRERSEEDGLLLLKLGVFDSRPDAFPVLVCPERPSMEVTAEKIWQGNLAALSSGIKHPERLASRHVPGLEQLLQKQEAIIRHLHGSLLVLQPVKALNSPELKDRMTTAFAHCRTGPLLRSLSIWLDGTTGLLKQQAQLSVVSADLSSDKRKLEGILQADKRDFHRQLLRTVAEVREHAEEALGEAACKLARDVLEKPSVEATDSIEARVQVFRATYADAARFGSDVAACLNKVFSLLVEQGWKDRVERQGALLERIYRMTRGTTNENEDTESPLIHYTRAARAYMECQSAAALKRPMALENAVMLQSDGLACSTSYDRTEEMPQAKSLLQAINQTCWNAMLGALETEGFDNIVEASKARVLKAFTSDDSSGEPLLQRLFSWAVKEHSQLLDAASEKSLQPLLQQTLPSIDRSKLTSLLGELTRLGEEAQRHLLCMTRSLAESEASQELPKPLETERPSKRQEFQLLPEVDYGGVQVDRVPGSEVSVTDLRPEAHVSDSEASTSGREGEPYRVTGSLRAGDRVLEKIEEYKAAVDMLGESAREAKSAPPVLFFLSYLEDQQSETSVRFDFQSGSHRCALSFVICKQAALHRRLLQHIPDTFLITIPDDSSTAGYFAAAQIIYSRLFDFDLERGHGSYVLVQNNIDGVFELSGKALASGSSTIQRTAAFLQQVLLQEREHAQHVVLTELSSREALLQLSDLLLDDLLDREVEPGQQMTREEQREVTRDFEAAFSPDRKLQEFPSGDLARLLIKCKGARTRRWLLACAQRLHPTAGVSICKARDQLLSYARHCFPDTLYRSNEVVPSFFLLVDARAMQALSPLHVAGYYDEGRFNQRLLSFARFCFKRLESQGRRCLASPLFAWHSKACVRKEEPRGLIFKQQIDDLHVSKIEHTWKHPPIPQTLPKPEGLVALSRRLPGPRFPTLPQTLVDGNGLAAAVSAVLPVRLDATSLRQLVGAFVRQNFRTLNLPDVASAQAAKKWAEVHAKEGSGLELDFAYAAAQASDVSITVAVIDQGERLRFYRACCPKAAALQLSYVLGFADGIYFPVGWSPE